MLKRKRNEKEGRQCVSVGVVVVQTGKKKKPGCMNVRSVVRHQKSRNTAVAR